MKEWERRKQGEDVDKIGEAVGRERRDTLHFFFIIDPSNFSSVSFPITCYTTDVSESKFDRRKTRQRNRNMFGSCGE